MNKLLKKSIKLMLGLIAAIGIVLSLPAETAFAAIQIDVVTIPATPTKANMYNISLTFDKQLPASGSGLTIFEYRIYSRNLSAGHSYGATPIATTNDLSAIVTKSFELQADPGKLYVFKAEVVYKNASGDEVAGPVVAEYAILTNIGVTATGTESGMKVTWDYPSLSGGAAFFKEYNIYVANIANGELSWDRVENRAIPVGALTFESGRASYTFSTPLTMAGRVYAVRIEPIVGTNERPNWPDKMSIEGKDNYYFGVDNAAKYMTDRGYVKPKLAVEETSLDYIKLTWDSLVNMPLTSNITSVAVHAVDENGVEKVVNRLIGSEAGRETQISIERPSKPTSYYIKVTYTDIQYTMATGLPPVDKYAVVAESIVVRYDPGAKEFEPYRPDIYEIKSTGDSANGIELSVTWKAFYRDALTELELENATNGKFLDKDVTYEIDITDDPNNFNYMTSTHSMVLDGNTASIIDGFYLRETFSTYYQRTSLGTLQEKDIEQNKIYFVRIKAIRNATNEGSKYAFDSYYVMPVERIPVEPNIIAKPPLRVKTVNGVEVVDDSTITVEWEEQWIEIYDPVEKVWHSKASLSGTTISFGDDVKDEDNFLVNSRSLSSDGRINKIATLDRIKTLLSGITDEQKKVLRMIDISGAQYRIHVAEYESAAKAGYDDYYKDITRESTTAKWDNIQANSTGAIAREYIVNKSHNPASTPLKEGTPYLVFLRPYFESEQGDKLAYYPSYVTATTLINRGAVDITPTVPILEAVPPAGDMSLTVRWRYVSELSYEMRIDDAFKNYPNGGNAISSEDIVEKGELKKDEATGETYMYYTISNLFPDNMYYIWIRSISENATGAVVSDWSNPLEMKTADIAPPPPPSGLGFASKFSLNLYNQENGTKLLSSDVGYLVVEWLRLSADVNNTTAPESSTTQAAPAAVTEENEKIKYLANPLMKDSYMVQLSELIANKNYYVRVKTRLSVTKNEDGSSARTYSYIAQFSPDEGFVDYIEIEVPKVADLSSGVYKDSEWTSISLFSEKSDSEYDGDKTAEMYPLPDKDFEVLYDNATNTLTYRFRSGEKDRAGQDDNMVDERFISRLVANRTFEYTLDLSTHGARVPKTRVIEFPYTIIAAFNERKINLKVKAGDYTVTFPYDSLMTIDVKSLKLDRNSKFRITIGENPAGIVDDGKTNYISGTHKLSVSVVTPAKTVNIINFAKPLKMSFAVSGQYVEGATNMGAYVQDGNTAGWQRLSTSAFDTVTKRLNFTSQRSANYSAIGMITPWSQTQAATLNQMYAVNSKIAIKDLGFYNENADINIVQFNQLMAVALRGSATVEINKALSTEDYNSLGKAKILVSGTGSSAVSREAGISAMVKLFEVKTKSPVTGYPTIEETGYSDIATADAAYRTAMLKAVELGFYRGATANPKGKLTFGDAMHMLDIILSY